MWCLSLKSFKMNVTRFYFDGVAKFRFIYGLRVPLFGLYLMELTRERRHCRATEIERTDLSLLIRSARCVTSTESLGRSRAVR